MTDFIDYMMVVGTTLIVAWVVVNLVTELRNSVKNK